MAYYKYEEGGKGKNGVIFVGRRPIKLYISPLLEQGTIPESSYKSQRTKAAFEFITHASTLLQIHHDIKTCLICLQQICYYEAGHSEYRIITELKDGRMENGKIGR